MTHNLPLEYIRPYKYLDLQKAKCPWNKGFEREKGRFFSVSEFENSSNGGKRICHSGCPENKTK